MKFFVAIALVVAVASSAIIKPTTEFIEIQQIIAAINSPSTDPATAAALEQMLHDVYGFEAEPIAIGPAIIGQSPISVGPAIIEQSPISVGPAIIEQSPISVGPAFIDFPLPDGGALTEVPASPVAVPAAVPAAESSPLVQIIVNVNQGAAGVAPAPVVIAQEEPTLPVHVVDESYDNSVDFVDVFPVVDPVDIVDVFPVVNPVVVDPVIVQTPVLPEPVQVVEPVEIVDVFPVVNPIGPSEIVDVFPVVNPIIVDPVVVQTPILPEPVQVVNPEVVDVFPVVNPVVIEPVVVGTPIIPAPAVVLPEELN